MGENLIMSVRLIVLNIISMLAEDYESNFGINGLDYNRGQSRKVGRNFYGHLYPCVVLFI